jgi:cytochrome c biogenesis protein CcmG/thiol:disulfide interchange protein DsbE
VEFVGVLFQDQKPSGRAFVKRWGDSWPTISDGGSAISIDYGVTGIPETFVIDRRGVIVARIVGPADSAALNSVLGQVTR